MKKIVLFLAVLFVAGIFSAKAQSPSDSSYARNLSYNHVNITSLPITVSGDLSSGSKILKDVRLGKRAIGYAIDVTSTQAFSFWLYNSGSSSWDEYLYLLDSNFNEVANNDDYNAGSFIVVTLTPGTYYILATEFSYNSSSRPYTLTIDQTTLVTTSTLTYTALGRINDTTVYDTFTSSYPYIIHNDVPYNIKGYSFQGTQNYYVVIGDSNYCAYYTLMDNNFNVVAESYYHNLAIKLPQTGTYYLAVMYYNGYNIKTHIRHFNTLPTYYIDGVNGDDSRNGLTPATALATLDTAFVRSDGVGKYYLTENYTFSGNELYPYYAMIYPYQKNIRLYMPNYGYDDLFENYGTLIFGEQGGNYYFIVDSNQNEEFDNFVDSYGYLEFNNLKINNSYIPYDFIYSYNETKFNNCEFINDTLVDDFIGSNAYYGTKITFENTTISQLKSDYNFISTNDHLNLTLRNSTISQCVFSNSLFMVTDSGSLTMENSNVTGNRFRYPVQIWGSSTANLTSGSWRNNTLETEFYNGNPNVNATNEGGIFLGNNSIANYGAGFTMDPNNFLGIDTTSIVNITENITVPLAAQIYPFKVENNQMVGDYYEGRPVLSGSANLLRANYGKFSVAQADNSSLWYIHNDGKIYTTAEPTGIASANEGIISLYPNPANNVLNIALEGTEVNEVFIIDIYGKTVVRTAVSNGTNSIDIRDLSAGMYFVQLRAAGSVKATEKLVKK